MKPLPDKLDKLSLDIMWTVATSSSIETRERPHIIFAKLLYSSLSEEDIGVTLKEPSP